MKKNYFNFKNTKTLVLGGSSGFGRHFSKVLSNAGSEVYVVARNFHKLKTLKKECEEENGKVNIFKCDINSENHVKKFLKNLKKKTKSLNLVIYCCGNNIRDEYLNIKFKDFLNVINTNYISAFKIYKKLFPFLKNTEYSRIINLTSIFSSRTIPKRTSYSASKSALLMLTKSLALEWSKHNITVNSISPGPFLTEINLPVLKNKKEYNKMCNKIPLGRFGNVDEVITAMLFLASKYSSYVNGSEIVVDGGWTVS